MHKSFIIAEIGVNHGNDMSKACLLIKEAKKAGADAVKFQTFSAETLASDLTPKAPYQVIRDKFKDHKSMLSELQLSSKNHLYLKKFCETEKIEFISTAYTLEDAKFLVSIGLKKIKIASADIIDTLMLDFLSKEEVITILSTGMASWTEIDRALEIFRVQNKLPWIMHCISEYPTPLQRANLSRISILKESYEGIVGYSDHTVGTDAARVAFGLGARLFEKHYTYDKEAIGPDHAASADINEFKIYVEAIRVSELVMGAGSFKRTEDENAMALTSRKSLHFSRDMNKGSIIDETDLILIRPGNGFTWDDRKLFVGKKIKIDVTKNKILDLNLVE